jgi:hypothetical protein
MWSMSTRFRPVSWVLPSVMWWRGPGRERTPRSWKALFGRRPRAEVDVEDFVVGHRLRSAAGLRVPVGNVSAYATGQGHWRPTRRWGRDRGKPAVVWIRVEGDGEYVYTKDLSYAMPMSRSVLHVRIDRLIAEDVAVVREHRGG